MTTTDALHERVGVLLVNTGTPTEPTPQAVKKYLGKFLSDPRICPMNPIAWKILLHCVILRKRSKASAAKYQQIWTPEGSPFQIDHMKLTAALSRHYVERGQEVHVECAMSHSEPSIVDGLCELRAAACDRLIILPLYPQSAYSTTGAVKDGVKRAFASMHWDVPHVVIDNYHDNVAYTDAIAAQILEAGFDPESNDTLLFSYHSIPIIDIEHGDTYELQVGASSLQIASEVGIARKQWTIAYQCRFDKGREWLKPYVSDTLTRLAKAGSGRVFFVCPNFAVDCLETLYDVGKVLEPFYRETAASAGRTIVDGDFVYVPCLNASERHVMVLADVLKPYIEGEMDDSLN